jgi:hypothetical protein
MSLSDAMLTAMLWRLGMLWWSSVLWWSSMLLMVLLCENGCAGDQKQAKECEKSKMLFHAHTAMNEFNLYMFIFSPIKNSICKMHKPEAFLSQMCFF